MNVRMIIKVIFHADDRVFLISSAHSVALVIFILNFWVLQDLFKQKIFMAHDPGACPPPELLLPPIFSQKFRSIRMMMLKGQQTICLPVRCSEKKGCQRLTSFLQRTLVQDIHHSLSNESEYL
ncbi:hypothetical protein DMENIID0001_031110 [Sergentomyia squamirostris]